jgi:hypothetical protein
LLPANKTEDMCDFFSKDGSNSAKQNIWQRRHLIKPVNFSLIAFESTHMISALAILAITFVTCNRKPFSNQQFLKLTILKKRHPQLY